MCGTEQHRAVVGLAVSSILMVSFLSPKTHVENPEMHLTADLGPINLKFNASLRLFTIDSLPVLWVYCQAKNKNDIPPHVMMSLKTLFCMNSGTVSVALIDHFFVQKYLSEDVNSKFFKLTDLHKSYYLGCVLLLRYGGISTPAEVIQMDHLQHLFNKLDSNLFRRPRFDNVKSPSDSPYITGPIVANSFFMQIWLYRINHVLDERFSDVPGQHMSLLYPSEWTEMLQNIPKYARLYTPPTFHTCHWGVFHEHNLLKVLEVVNVTELKQRTHLIDFNTPLTLLRHPDNSKETELLRKRLETLTIDGLLKNNSMISLMFRRSIDRCPQLLTTQVRFLESRIDPNRTTTTVNNDI